MPEPNKKALYAFLAVLLTAFGLFLIVPSQIEIINAKKAKDWIPRKARITHSETGRYGGGRGHDIARYVPDIRGVFLDTGEEFEVYRVAFAEIGNRSVTESYVDRFAEGSIVEVYVSPEDPGKVVLIRDVPLMQMYVMQTIGALVIGLAAFSLYSSRKYSPPGAERSP